MRDSSSAPILPFYAGFFLYLISLCVSSKEPRIFIYLGWNLFPFYAYMKTA